MLLTLINDLLDLAKFETMNFKFNEEFFNLNDLISKAYDTMKYQAAQKKINIIRDYEIRITDTNSKYYGMQMSFEDRRNFFKFIHGDQLRYMQILLNFLSNAIKFTSEGHNITIRIILLDIQDAGVSKMADNGSVPCQSIYGSDKTTETYIKFAIEIEDEGVGISQENLGKIFVDFMKLDEHEKINHQGTGLGLSICKLIVEKMRGTINVDSVPGKGTTFQIIICSKIKM